MTSRLLGAAVGALLILGMVGATGAATAAPHGTRALVGPLVNATHHAGNEDENAITVQQTHPNNLTIVANNESGPGLFHSWSTDGGATWSTDVIADGDNLGSACCDPSLTSDEFGNIFLAYLSASIVNKVAVSTDGGATFGALADLPATGPIGSAPGKIGSRSRLPGGDQPTIIAGKGEVWITYTANNDLIQAIGAPVTGLGQVGAFGTPETAPNTNCSACDYGDIAIGPAGQVMVAYQTPSGGEGPAAIFTALDPDGLGPSGFDTPTHIASTNVGGFDFIPAQPHRSVDAEVGLAWDRSGGPFDGRLYAMWTSEFPQESNDMDIMVRYSDNQGATWSAPVRVNNDTGTTSQFFPKIAVDETSGHLVLSWYDDRLDHGQGGTFDTNGVPNDDAIRWMAFSVNGGGSWFQRPLESKPSNATAANNSLDYGDFEGLTFFGGKAHPSWADNTNLTGDNPNGAYHALDLYTTTISI